MSIYITGIGTVSALGLNAEENFNSIKNYSTGISSSPKNGDMIAAVSLSNDEIIQLLGLKSDDFSRTTLLAMLAAKEAWGSNIQTEKIRTGMVFSTSLGNMDRVERYYYLLKRTGRHDFYHLMTNDYGQITDTIAGLFGIRGFIDTISTACSSGANAIMHGARLIDSGRLDRVLVGGCDPLINYNMKGFSALDIYDREICKPFDASRKGLNLGEGAGFLILENKESRALSGKEPLCRISGWSNASDAYHQTATSPEGLGSMITMSKALEKALLIPNEIDYINAHGTGTENNDLSESFALKTVFSDKVPAFSSTKGFTGHTLAAAGAIEAVFCVQAIISQTLLPNLNYKKPIQETGLIPEKEFRPASIKHVLSNSFGFGGNCTSLIFSKS